MALFDEIFGAALGESPENRPESPRSRPAESEHSCGESPRSPRSPADAAAKVAPSAPCEHCGCRHYWHDGSGWRCEGCNPPAADASRFITVSGGKPAPMPPPALPWPADLTEALKRVSTAFEWSRADIADFTRWARRSPQGLADARVFLAAEVAKLPPPGLDDRRRVVLDRLAADPGARVAWTCTDDGVTDPVRLTLAIRGKGTCELAIPRAKFDALALPQLIGELAERGDE